MTGRQHSTQVQGAPLGAPLIAGRAVGRKRAQLNTLEPIIITILIVIILGVALLFFVRINRGEAQAQTRQLKDQEDTATLSRITRLPELACSADVSASTNCIDLEKAKAFKRLFDSDATIRARYAYVFGTNAEVNITVLNVEGGRIGEPISFVTGTFDPAKARMTTTYFVVYDPKTQRRNFAIMTVRRAA